MKRTALQFLRCPNCRQSLRLAARHADRESVESGWLICEPCPEAYRIVNGIPRFVRSDQYTLKTDRRWNSLIRIYLDSAVGTTEAEDTLAACTGWRAPDYRGHLVLDVGVGTGRFTEAAARYGCEVVGVDFNGTVDCAHHNLARFQNVHLIQAELSALPFACGTFDLAYSIGVLRHTPDPAQAFAQVAHVVKPSGCVAVSLNNDRRFAQRNAARIRYLTTRIPLSLVLSAAALSIPLYYGDRVPLLGTMLQSVC